MNSAFGIEHGDEISKIGGFRLPGMSAAGGKHRGTTSGSLAGGSSFGGARKGPGAGAMAGGKLKSLAMAKPKTALGVGAAGVGGTGYMAGRKNSRSSSGQIR